MASQAPGRLVDGGAMGAVIRAYDWKHTPVGALDDWPQDLCTRLQTVLNARPPMAICWGRELYHFYNDTYDGVGLLRPGGMSQQSASHIHGTVEGAGCSVRW